MISGLVARVRSLWRGVRRRPDIEAEMHEEFRAHIDLRADDLVRSGLAPDEAYRQARGEFGSPERYKEEGRGSRGLAPVDELRFSWIDVKLGARMLIKYPGLTIIGGLGMAVAIAISAGYFALISGLFSPLPLDDGDRVVALQLWDAETEREERRILHDFFMWREELESVVELGAATSIARTLITPDRQVSTVNLSQITASAFRLARVPPLLGRPLLDADEHQGSPPVLVIGYDLWRTRFASDSTIVGRSARLGGTEHTIVGVMPPGFAFPVSHTAWAPLRADPHLYERREGPELLLFGRLAPGATLASAQAELATVGSRASSADPESHRHLRPLIMPYTDAFNERDDAWEFRLTQGAITLLLIVISVNVAALVYARTATRYGEIAVRSALGASRRRIVAQLFAEALALSLCAAAAGLMIAGIALSQLNALLVQFGVDLPFWMAFRLSPGTVVYTMLLAVLAGVIVGVGPALKATGRRLETALRQLGGGTGMQLGNTWTVLIVAQVAFAIAVLPASAFFCQVFVRYGFADPGFAATEYLTTRLMMDREIPPSAEAESYDREFEERYALVQAELLRRLESEPTVGSVVQIMNLPGLEAKVRIEVDGSSKSSGDTAGQKAPPRAAGHVVGVSHVDVEFFDVFDVPVLAGRGFHSGDRQAASATRIHDEDRDGFSEFPSPRAGAPSAVIANRAFVEQILIGGHAVGRRVRYAQHAATRTENPASARWFEIVGVVENFPANSMFPEDGATGGARPEAALYHPMAHGEVTDGIVMRMVGATPASFVGRLQELTLEVDSRLRLHKSQSLDEALRQEQKVWRLSALGLAIVTLSVLLLSAAGIYALTSFTVAQRRREIGVRAALGADSRRIMSSILSRVLRQLAIGVVLGALAGTSLLVWANATSGSDLVDGKGGVLLLGGISAFVVVIGLLAVVGPVRRGLRIQPTEALRAE